MQSFNERIGSKIRLKWTVPWFSVFVDQTNLKIIWKFSLSRYRCHKTPIDVENYVKSTSNSNLRKQKFTVITNWGGGDYQLRIALAAKHIWLVVITRWGTLDSPHRLAFVLVWLFHWSDFFTGLTFLLVWSWYVQCLFQIDPRLYCLTFISLRFVPPEVCGSNDCTGTE